MVMASEQKPLIERVESSFRKLSTAASDLNFTSDELGKSISQLDAALKKLNLGVSAWVEFGGNADAYEGWYRTEELGYDKIGNTWGIALRVVRGRDGAPEDEQIESWLFNDGPRSMRLLAIEEIPQLLEKLSTKADETAKKIRLKLAEVQEVAAVVKKAAEEPAKPRAVSATLKLTVSPAPPAPEATPGLRHIGNVIPPKPATEGGQK
jgi:hypothetical protein